MHPRLLSSHHISLPTSRFILILINENNDLTKLEKFAKHKFLVVFYRKGSFIGRCIVLYCIVLYEGQNNKVIFDNFSNKSLEHQLSSTTSLQIYILLYSLIVLSITSIVTLAILTTAALLRRWIVLKKKKKLAKSNKYTPVSLLWDLFEVSRRTF